MGSQNDNINKKTEKSINQSIRNENESLVLKGIKV